MSTELISLSRVISTSGSGSQPRATTHHPERFGNFKAYRPLTHQHAPEIEGALGEGCALDFVPHSAPIARGIHVTAFVPLTPGTEDRVVPIDEHIVVADIPIMIELHPSPAFILVVNGERLAMQCFGIKRRI